MYFLTFGFLISKGKLIHNAQIINTFRADIIKNTLRKGKNDGQNYF